MKLLTSLLLFCFFSLTAISQDYKAGSKIDILWHSTWYKGSILEVKDDKYKIHYDGYGASWDEWVTKDRIRAQGADETNKAAGATEAKKTVPPVNSALYKDTNGKLYFRTFMWTGTYGSSLDMSWIYLGNNGSIVIDPTHGVNPVNFAAELADNAENVGKYKIAGNTLHITWTNGKTDSWSLESKGGELTAINSGIVSRPDPLPTNYKLDGQYAASAVLPNVSSVHTFVFRKDGTFTLNQSGAVYTADASALSESNSTGTYNISGNTLRLNYANGEKQVATIYLWDQKGGKKFLVINKSSFPQE